jgi:hypothetical protein
MHLREQCKLVTMLAASIGKKNFRVTATYVQRFSPEVQVMFYREVLKKVEGK